MEKLREFRFEWVMPGHQGGAYHASSDSIRQQMEQCVEWMKSVPKGQYVCPHPSFGGPKVEFYGKIEPSGTMLKTPV
jgi:hypothetical protein